MTRDPIPDWDRDPIEVITAPVSARRPSRLQQTLDDLTPDDDSELVMRIHHLFRKAPANALV